MSTANSGESDIYIVVDHYYHESEPVLRCDVVTSSPVLELPQETRDLVFEIESKLQRFQRDWEYRDPALRLRHAAYSNELLVETFASILINETKDDKRTDNRKLYVMSPFPEGDFATGKISSGDLVERYGNVSPGTDDLPGIHIIVGVAVRSANQSSTQNPSTHSTQ